MQEIGLDDSAKWYLNKPESGQWNVMNKILRDFEIQMDHLIPAWGSDLVIVNKKRKEPVE